MRQARYLKKSFQATFNSSANCTDGPPDCQAHGRNATRLSNQEMDPLTGSTRLVRIRSRSHREMLEPGILAGTLQHLFRLLVCVNTGSCSGLRIEKSSGSLLPGLLEIRKKRANGKWPFKLASHTHFAFVLNRRTSDRLWQCSYSNTVRAFSLGCTSAASSGFKTSGWDDFPQGLQTVIGQSVLPDEQNLKLFRARHTF